MNFSRSDSGQDRNPQVKRVHFADECNSYYDGKPQTKLSRGMQPLPQPTDLSKELILNLLTQKIHWFTSTYYPMRFYKYLKSKTLSTEEGLKATRQILKTEEAYFSISEKNQRYSVLCLRRSSKEKADAHPIPMPKHDSDTIVYTPRLEIPKYVIDSLGELPS